MTEEQLAEFIADLKSYLGITWDLQLLTPTDYDLQRLTQIVRAGEAYLNEKNGAAADYTVPGMPRTLLFEFCRYARDNALDVFENNYQSLILTMQNQRLVSVFEQQAQAQEVLT